MKIEKTKLNQKGLIITGKRDVGKSLLLKSIREAYPPNYSADIDGRTFTTYNTFLFRNISLSTKVIFIHDLKSVSLLQSLIQYVFNDITVEKQLQSPFKMPCPKLIVECDESISIEDVRNLGPSFARRFEAIEIKSCGYNG